MPVQQQLLLDLLLLLLAILGVGGVAAAPAASACAVASADAAIAAADAVAGLGPKVQLLRHLQVRQKLLLELLLLLQLEEKTPSWEWGDDARLSGTEGDVVSLEGGREREGASQGREGCGVHAPLLGKEGRRVPLGGGTT